LRQLNCYRKALVHDITAQKNRVEKFLQSSGFRLSTFMSSIFGTSGINIMYILKGSIFFADLDICLKARSRNRIDEIMPALNDSLDEKQRRLLKMLLSHLQDLQDNLGEIEDDITLAMLSYKKTLPSSKPFPASVILQPPVLSQKLVMICPVKRRPNICVPGRGSVTEIMKVLGRRKRHVSIREILT
jgi:hypothetical protein